MVRWSQRQRRTGSAAPDKIGGHRRPVLEEHRAWLLGRAKTDFTLRGLVAELAERGVKVDYVQVWRFVHAERLSLKKSVLPTEQLRPKMGLSGISCVAGMKGWKETLDQPINAASFTAWIEQQLAPTLAPGDVVVMDNLSSHTKPAVRSAIRARGARLLFLPPYSPDLSPIEQVFAKLKHLLRKAAERSHEATWRRLGILLDRFAPDECANYLRNSGYGAA